MSALRSMGKSVDDLKDQRIVIMGCGSAGLGVAAGIRQAMIHQGANEMVRRFCSRWPERVWELTPCLLCVVSSESSLPVMPST